MGFKKDGRELNVRVEDQLVFITGSIILKTAPEGRVQAYLPEGQLESYITSGNLVHVLKPYSGYHLYYPGHRQPTPAFSLLVDELRYSTRDKHLS